MLSMHGIHDIQMRVQDYWLIIVGDVDKQAERCGTSTTYNGTAGLARATSCTCIINNSMAFSQLDYRQVSNIRRTQPQHLKDSHTH